MKARNVSGVVPWTPAPCPPSPGWGPEIHCMTLLRTRWKGADLGKGKKGGREKRMRKERGSGATFRLEGTSGAVAIAYSHLQLSRGLT